MAALSRLLRPDSVVYVGGSQIAGPIRAARRAGYEGRMWVVNPEKDEIEGIACAASVGDLPGIPDAAVVGLSPERSIAAVEALEKQGCGGAVIMSSGFGELNTPKGQDRQKRLAAAAREMPLLGPNCMGLINQFTGAFVWGDDNHCERQSGPSAAIISQSGAMLIGITGVERAFPLGYGVSIGNQAVTTAAELIQVILEDDRIKAIGLYLEGMDEGEPLGRACLEALRAGVPVIALKGGDNAEGAVVARSHTASMVVERDLWDAFKERFGLEEASSPKALVETLKLLTVAGLPNGNRLSIVSYSGGLNSLAAARCDALGLRLPLPNARNASLLRETLPETVTITNPLDLNIPFGASDGSVSMRDTTAVANAICKFAADVSDQIVFFIDVPRPGAGHLDKVWCDSLEALIEVRKELGIPVSIAGILPEGLPEEFRLHLHANGVAGLLGFIEVLEALAISARLAARSEELKRMPLPAHLLACRAIDRAAMMDEAKSKNALKGFGLITPKFEAVPEAEAAAAAERLGFPVALKILSDTIAHKAEVGGVHLNLNSLGEVAGAVAQMKKAIFTAMDGHSVNHVLVEKMIEGADLELIIGIKRHGALGLALMVGYGGTRTEDTGRFETALLPLQDDVLDRIFAKLDIHEHPGIAALRLNCQAVAAYAEAFADRLVTLDVNPVVLTKAGQAVAADAMVVLAEAASS